MATDIRDLYQFAQQGFADGQQNRFNRLAGAAFNAPRDQRQGLLGQAAMINPAGAMQMGGAMQGQDDAKMKRMANMAMYLAKAPEAARPAIYRQIVSELQQAFPGEYPRDYTPEVGQMAESIVQAFGGGAEQDQGMKSLSVGGNGNFYAIKGGELVDTGVKASESYRPIETEGGYQAFGSRSGTAKPLMSGDQDAAPQPAQGGIRINPAMFQGLDPSSQQALLQQILADSQGQPLTPQGQQLRPVDPVARAAAVERAKLGAQIDLAPHLAEADADRAGKVEAAKAGAQFEASRREAAPKARRALTSARNKAEIVNRAVDAAMPAVNVWTSGMVGRPLSALGGTAAADLRANIDTIEANLGFSELQQMRASSPTGGALGSITERELELLAATIANVKQSQSPAQLKQNLQFVKDQYNKVLSQMESDFQMDYAQQRQQSPSNIDALLDKYR